MLEVWYSYNIILIFTATNIATTNLRVSESRAFQRQTQRLLKPDIRSLWGCFSEDPFVQQELALGLQLA